jgi:hypothetical protein
MGGQALLLEGAGARLPALWATKSRLQLGGFETENVGEEGGKKRMMSEGLEEGSVAPLEFSDGVMEQVEAMAKELRNISGGIWALVEGIGRLMEVVEEVGKEEVKKEDKEAETEDVQRMDKQTETEKREEDSEQEEESEAEEGKEDGGKEDGEQEMEEMEKE